MVSFVFPDGSKAFVDDSRLSKLVRRLVKEDDRERKLTAIKQLKDYLQAYENIKVTIYVLAVISF